jgi:hypothetical protein
MQEFAIGSLSLITGSNAVAGFILQTPIEGLDSPAHRTNAYARAGQDGQTVSGQFYDGRIVKLVGKIDGTTVGEFETNRKALIAATAINRDSNNYPVPIRVSFTSMAGQAYYVDVYFDKPIMDLENPISGDFMVIGVCADPFIYATTGVTSGAISPPSGGGYEVPMIVPYISAAATGGSVTLNNAGSEKAWPIITLTGPLTTPVVTNATTGVYLQLSYTIATGDEVIIDMYNHTITLDGGSLISTKTSASDWWSIATGNNTISLTTTSSGDTGSMVVAFNTPYIGV